MLNQSRLRVLVKVSAAAVIVAACGAKPAAVAGRVARPAPAPALAPAPAPAPASLSSSPVVHVQSIAGVTTIGGNGNRWTAPGAAATPDWSTMFTVQANRLRTLDGVTGAERASQPVGPGLRPVVSSADGRFVALTDSPVRVGQGVLPAGRSRSMIVVAPADPATGQMRTIGLEGNFVPEGFSTDASRLFVIEFVPAMHPDRYRVRSMDISTGEIVPVYTYDKTIDTEVMQGLSRTQVFSANGSFGSMLYTLYSRAAGPVGYGELHALSLDFGLVHCTEFPPSIKIGPSGGAIAVSPDGQRVYVASEQGTVAEIDASNSSQQQPFPIAHTTQLVAGAGTGTVALTADDHTVWVALGTRLIGLDATDLHQTTTTTVSQPVHALAVTQRESLYVATSDTIEVIDPATGVARSVTSIDVAPNRLGVD